MTLTIRRYRSEDDYWRIRAFLRRLFLFNDRRELSWQAYRFDYWRWHGVENLGHGSLEEGVFLWETAGGEIAAVLHPEGPGDAFLQLHPGLCTPDLAGECAEPSEKSLASQPPLLQPKLTVNPPNDRYEQEADRVAEQVTRMPEPAIQRAPANSANEACGMSSSFSKLERTTSSFERI